MNKYLTISPNWCYNRACRVCLDVNTKLYFLHSNNLASIYTELTMLPVSATDDMPQYICMYCRQLLVKAVKFKRKCYATLQHLQTLIFGRKRVISLQYLKTLNRSNFKLPYEVAPMLTDDIPPAVPDSIDKVPPDTDLRSDGNKEVLLKDLNIERHTLLKYLLQSDSFISDLEKDLQEKRNKNDFNDLTLASNINSKNDNVVDSNSQNDRVPNDGNDDFHGNNESCNVEIDGEFIIDNNEVLNLTEKMVDDNINNNSKVGNVVANVNITFNKDNSVNVTIDKDNIKLNTKENDKTEDSVTKNNNTKDNTKFNPKVSKKAKKNVKIKIAKPVKTKEWKTKLQRFYKYRNDDFKTKFIDYVLTNYEQNTTEGIKTKHIQDIITEEDLDYIFDNVDGERNDNPEQMKAIEDIESNTHVQEIKDIAKDDTVPVTTQVFYAYVRDIYLDKKKEFSNKEIKKRSIDYNSAYETHIRLKTENFLNLLQKIAKKYNFEVREFSPQEQVDQYVKSKEVYKDSPFRCKFCLRGFNLEKHYITHMVCHKPTIGCAFCPICGARCYNARRLAHHSLTHKYQLQCNTCSLFFRVTNGHPARLHFDMHNGKQFQCEECGKLFQKNKTYLEHKRVVHGRVRCAVCYCRVTAALPLQQHHAKMHSQTYPCEVCSTVFNTEEARDTHIQTTLYKDMCTAYFACAACGQNFVSQSEREDHITAHHTLTKKIATKRPYCKCANNGDIEGHLEGYQDGNRKRKCTCVDERSERYNRNQRERMLVCEQCGTKCRNVAQLEAHKQRRHDGDADVPVILRPFTCHVCDKVFSLKQTLLNHLRTHTDEKNFHCGQCGNTFKHFASLYKHRYTVHEKRPSYKCDLCDKKYFTTVKLQKHFKTIHLGMPPPNTVRRRQKTRQSERDGTVYMERELVQGDNSQETEEQEMEEVQEREDNNEEEEEEEMEVEEVVEDWEEDTQYVWATR